MNMRSSKINLKELQDLTDQVIKKITEEEDKEYYLVIGSPALRTPSKVNKIAYLFASDSNLKTSTITFPEFHKQNEKFLFCECPDFCYVGRLENKLCQAISLEAAAKMASKIKGLLITINYSDLYTSRASAYKELILKLGQLFNNDFEKLIKSSVFIIPKTVHDINKGDYIESMTAFLKMRKEELQAVEEYSDDESEDQIKQAKIEIAFTELFVSHPNQVFFLDTYDQGESREAILNALLELSPIELSAFHFENSYTETLKGFDFNVRKYIDDMLGKVESSKLRIEPV